jgi:dCTP deaminase
MTILSAQTIRREMVIAPFNERTVAFGMSYGLSAAGYDMRIAEGVTVPAGGFVLATTLERFEFPDDVLGKLADKSSWARRGVAVQNTIFEPGWRGYPTLEISNHGDADVTIPAGAPIAQMIFHRLDAPTESPYRGKYQDQPQKPVPALDEGAKGDVGNELPHAPEHLFLSEADVDEVHGVIVTPQSVLGGGRVVQRWPSSKVIALKALARRGLARLREGARPDSPVTIIPHGIARPKVDVPCRFGCRAPAVGIFYVPEGCICWPDPVQALCAQHVVTAESIGPVREIVSFRDPAAGKRAGGYARAAALTPARRTEIARKAANSRWGKQRGLGVLMAAFAALWLAACDDGQPWAEAGDARPCAEGGYTVTYPNASLAVFGPAYYGVAFQPVYVPTCDRYADEAPQ